MTNGREDMKLGESKMFFAVRIGDTDKFHIEAGQTTNDLLRARLYTEHDKVEIFRDEVKQCYISISRKVPILEIVRIRITINEA
jgi:hypothetical protein